MKLLKMLLLVACRINGVHQVMNYKSVLDMHGMQCICVFDRSQCLTVYTCTSFQYPILSHSVNDHGMVPAGVAAVAGRHAGRGVSHWGQPCMLRRGTFADLAFYLIQSGFVNLGVNLSWDSDTDSESCSPLKLN